jgi:hypothetical protein
MPIRIVVAAVLVLGLYGANGVRAESEQDREACTPDVHSLCGEFIPDRDAIIACLKKKMRQLSPDCRRVMSRPYRPDRG